MVRFHVVGVKDGYAVKDTRDNTIWTKTYTRLGWAVRKAVALNEAHRYYSTTLRRYVTIPED